ncbi:sugar ABC transporter substrate-binding protein [Salinibacterium sp.]|uniref:sugar ABC transporter substrate-binding protein n=1 Tax=Salinibacterium sp. TaxID=1915057 RepID=UPI002869F76B|nr:sugar ABC transporter substrate-binding protein [Salinibacterium sp.]
MTAHLPRRVLRTAAAAVAVLVVTALSACGTTASAPNSSSKPSGDGKTLSSVEDFALTADQVAKVKDKKLRFGFLMNNIADDFSKTLVSSGQEWADKYKIKLIVNSSDFDANKQLSQFNALVQQKVDGIFLTAVDAASIGTAVVRANNAKIPVFIVGGAPARGKVVSVMNAASYDGSKEAGAALMKAINKPNAKIAVIGIPFALQTIRDREKGILDAVGAAGGQVVSLQSDFSQDKLLALATNVIEANPDLDGIFATWSLGVNAATEAVKQSGRNIPIAGYDAEAAGYKEFAKGNANLIALSGQQAFVQGKAAIEGLAQVVLGNTLAPQIITPNILVTKDNYAKSWTKQYPSTPTPY